MLTIYVRIYMYKYTSTPKCPLEITYLYEVNTYIVTYTVNAVQFPIVISNTTITTI